MSKQVDLHNARIKNKSRMKIKISHSYKKCVRCEFSNMLVIEIS